MTTTKATKRTPAETGRLIRDLTVSAIDSVYSGTPNKCCCGCSGKHYDRSSPMFARMAAKVLQTLKAAKPEEVDDGGSYLSIEPTATRILIAYLPEDTETAPEAPAPAAKVGPRPSPWRASNARVVDANDREICEVPQTESHPSAAQACATANLMALAPDMLAALREVDARLSGVDELLGAFPDAADGARKALAAVYTVLARAEGGAK